MMCSARRYTMEAFPTTNGSSKSWQRCIRMNPHHVSFIISKGAQTVSMFNPLRYLTATIEDKRGKQHGFASLDEGIQHAKRSLASGRMYGITAPAKDILPATLCIPPILIEPPIASNDSTSFFCRHSLERQNTPSAASMSM